jgi:putative acetyltransferase
MLADTRTMTIREAKRADARQIVRIFHDTIHTVNTRDYTTEQVNAWSPVVPDAEEWAERKFPTRTTFVADDEGIIAGFGELEDNGHVDCFYCHHAYQRRGVGSAILRRIEDKARTLRLTRLFTEASITARPFFEIRGFAVVRWQTVICRDVEFANFVMEKTLTANKTLVDTARKLADPQR